MRIAAGRLTGALLADADLAELELEGCQADLAAFAGARLSRVRIADCDLHGSDWQAARLRAVEMQNCDPRDADFSGTRFESVELRNCRLEGIRGAAGLKGVSMSFEDILANAAVFATACGIRIANP